MATPAALYYPHTNISDPSIIKNALLLWDQIEYMTPEINWTHERYSSRLLNEAIDLIGIPHYPTDSERQEAHKRLSELANNELPPWFFLDASKSIKNFNPYSIFPSKFETETWEFLRNRSLANVNPFTGRIDMTPFWGSFMMSILADVCAGTTKTKITDRGDAYTWLQKYATIEAGGEFVTGLDVSQVAPHYARLVTLSMNVLDTEPCRFPSW